MENKVHIKSLLYALAAVFFWSTAATVFKLTLHGLTYAQLLLYASIVAAIVMVPFAIIDSPKELLNFFKGKNFLKNLLLGFINPFLYYLVLFKAYELLPAQEAQPLNYTWPIAIAIFSVIFLDQKLSVKTIIGLALAFFGVVVIATRGDIFGLHFHNLFGVILAAGSSVIWASFWILSIMDKRSGAIKLFSSFTIGAILTAIYVALFDSFTVADPVYLWGAVYVGLFEKGITFFFWMKGLQLSTNKAKTSSLAYLSPFLSLVFIAFVLGEKILLSSIVGLVFIVGGIVLQQIENFRKKKVTV